MKIVNAGVGEFVNDGDEVCYFGSEGQELSVHFFCTFGELGEFFDSAEAYDWVLSRSEEVSGKIKNFVVEIFFNEFVQLVCLFLKVFLQMFEQLTHGRVFCEEVSENVGEH